MLRALARSIVLVALAVSGITAGACGGSGDSGSGGGGSTTHGAGGGCPGGAIAVPDGSCAPVGVQGCAASFVDDDGICRPSTSKCGAGEIPQFEKGCVAVGIAGCAEAFVEDGVCRPRASKCASASFAVPEKGCLPIDGADGCGTGTWGDIPDAPGNVYVDPTAPAGGDGKKATPVRTIAAAMTRVGAGGRIALAAGEYNEAPTIDSAIGIVGRCPSMVTVDGDDGDPSVPAVFFVGAGPSAIRHLRISGDGVGVYVGSAAGVTLDGVHIDGAVLGGVVAVSVPTDVTITGSFISGTRGFQEQGGMGVAVADGAHLTIEHSALLGNHLAGVAIGDPGSHVTAEDVLVEDTRGQELDGNGGQGFILSVDSSLDLRASAIVTSTYVGLEGSDAGTTIDASQVVIEGTRPDPVSMQLGAGVDVSAGAGITLADSVLVGNISVGVFVHDTLSHAKLDRVLVADTASQAIDGLYGNAIVLQDTATVEATDCTFVRSRDLAVDVLGNASATLTRVLIEDTRPRDGDGEWGVALGATGGAGLTLDSVVVLGAHGAGLLNAQATAVIANSLFSGIEAGTFTLIGMPDPLTDIADGALTMFAGDTTVGTSRFERCARAGVLFDGSTGHVTLVSSTLNRFGLVIDGSPTPEVDDASAIEGNDEQDRVNDGNLPVPDAPSPLPI